MAYAQWVGTFKTEEEALRKITTMREDGVGGEEIAVLVEDESALSLLNQESDIQLETIEDTWAEKILNAVEMDDKTNDTLNTEGLDTDIKQQYKEELEEGNIIVFVARRDESMYESEPIENPLEEGIPLEYKTEGEPPETANSESEDIPITEQYREKQTEQLQRDESKNPYKNHS